MSLKLRAKSLLGRGLVRSGLHRTALGPNGVIVAFHRVEDALAEDGLTVSSARFVRFCKFFRANFDVIPLGEFVTRLERGSSVAGALTITFDDGYLDNYQVAAPILRQLSLPATFFMTTKFLGSEAVPWWDAELPHQPGWMSWDHVRELASDGFDIGAHTRTHVDLGQVLGDEAELEIQGSRRDLIDELGRTPDHFAFPYGRPVNLLDANRELVRKAGFSCCVSCYGGLAPNGADRFGLCRVPISPWFETPEQFAFELLSLKT